MQNKRCDKCIHRREGVCQGVQEGCRGKEQTMSKEKQKTRLIDLSGKRFGKLVVIERV